MGNEKCYLNLLTFDIIKVKGKITLEILDTIASKKEHRYCIISGLVDLYTSLSDNVDRKALYNHIEYGSALPTHMVNIVDDYFKKP